MIKIKDLHVDVETDEGAKGNPQGHIAGYSCR